MKKIILISILCTMIYGANHLLAENPLSSNEPASLQEPSHHSEATIALKKGIISYKRDDIESARKYFREAIDLQPSLADAHYNLAFTMMNVLGNDYTWFFMNKRYQKYEDIQRELESTVKYDNNNYKAHMYLGFLYLLPLKNLPIVTFDYPWVPNISSEQYDEKIMRHISNKWIGEAVDEFIESAEKEFLIASEHLSDWRIYCYLGWISYLKKNYDESLNAYKKALKNWPDHLADPPKLLNSINRLEEKLAFEKELEKALSITETKIDKIKEKYLIRFTFSLQRSDYLDWNDPSSRVSGGAGLKTFDIWNPLSGSVTSLSYQDGKYGLNAGDLIIKDSSGKVINQLSPKSGEKGYYYHIIFPEEKGDNVYTLQLTGGVGCPPAKSRMRIPKPIGRGGISEFGGSLELSRTKPLVLKWEPVGADKVYITLKGSNTRKQVVKQFKCSDNGSFTIPANTWEEFDNRTVRCSTQAANENRWESTEGNLIDENSYALCLTTGKWGIVNLRLID